MIGRIIGNYRITSELAHGGMGTVYRGQHLHLPREIVVKSILLGAFSPSAQSHLKARFRREAYIQSQLDHPNIVRVYEFFAAEDNYYLVMEYVPGMTLRDLLARQGTPTPSQAVYLCKQALSALEFAHNFTYVDESDLRHTGIIHRDIKPANMLLDNKGKLKITDFGIVKVMGDQTTAGMTQTGFHPGTVEYMSPEQLLGLDIDVRSDLYSLGVTFYEMLSGRLPFERSATGSDWEVRKGHIEVPPPPILDLRPEIPPTLAAIIMRSLQKSPNERYQSSAEFMEALQIHERTVGEFPTKSTSGRLTKPLITAITGHDAATLLDTKPTSKSFPSSSARSVNEEAETIPLAKLRADNPVNQISPANSRNTPKQAFSINLTPTDEETIIAVRPKSTGSKFRLIAVVSLLMVAAASAGAYFFSYRKPANENNLSAQVGVLPSESPSPTITPKPIAKPKPTANLSAATASAPTPAPTPSMAERGGVMLNQAKALEDREQYSEAIAKYQEYQQLNLDSSEASLVSSKLQQLTILSRVLGLAKADMEARRYNAAMEKYRQALRVKSNSAIAQAGEAEARAKMATEMPQIRIDRPELPIPGQIQKPNRRRMPPTLKRTSKPDSPPDPEKPL
jgi:serine/threonine protein kinase